VTFTDDKVVKSIGKFRSLAADWVAGDGVEESLWWVAYASRPGSATTATTTTTTTTAEGGSTTGIDTNQKLDSDTCDDDNINQVHHILGDVSGKELLGQIARDALSIRQRRDNIIQYCQLESKRVQKLAEALTKEAQIANRTQSNTKV
jgi:hypothetical protein